MAYQFGGHGSLKAQKKFLRNRFKSIRDRLPRRTRINLSRRVCLRLAEYIEQFGEDGRTLRILAYHAVGSELDLQRLIGFNFKSLSNGYYLIVPIRIQLQFAIMILVEIWRPML